MTHEEVKALDWSNQIHNKLFLDQSNLLLTDKQAKLLTEFPARTEFQARQETLLTPDQVL